MEQFSSDFKVENLKASANSVEAPKSKIRKNGKFFWKITKIKIPSNRKEWKHISASLPIRRATFRKRILKKSKFFTSARRRSTRAWKKNQEVSKSKQKVEILLDQKVMKSGSKPTSHQRRNIYKGLKQKIEIR